MMKKLVYLLALALWAGVHSSSAQTYTDGALNTLTTNRKTSSTTLAALNATVTVKLEGRPGAGIFITTANLNAIVSAELSMDEGVTWRASEFMAPDGSTSATITFSGGAATEQRAVVVLGGTTHVRARVSTYTSGTSTAVARVTTAGSFALRAPTALDISALLTTAAHDAAFGTAGTADTQVRTVQGIASMTPVQVSQATASNLNATVTDGSGPLTVDGTVAVTGPLTDAQLRAVAVPVSGTVTASGPLTDAQLRAATVPISGTVTITDGAGAVNVIVDSGSITANAGTDLNTSALLTTSAHDAAFGTAGSADSQVRTIQGVASMTPVQVSQATASNLNATVTDGAGALNTIVDSGSLTANAGTNLNTSALALDATLTGRFPVGANPADNESNTSAQSRVGAYTFVYDGSTWDRWTGAVSQSGAPWSVQGSVAHDSAVSANPVPGGAVSESGEDSDANTSANRVSADGEMVRVLATRYGAISDPCGMNPFRWVYHENSSSAITDTTIHASCGTGLFNYICSITGSTGAATAWSVLIEDSTTTTILGPYYLEAVLGRGFSVVYPGGRKQTNSATLIAVTTVGAIAHSLDITGFCAP